MYRTSLAVRDGERARQTVLLQLGLRGSNPYARTKGKARKESKGILMHHDDAMRMCIPCSKLIGS